MKPWLHRLLGRAAIAAPTPHGLTGDHLIIVRRAVARSYRDDGAEPLARLVESGHADDAQRMKGGIAAVEAVLLGLLA